jgi:tetratricopeptide (TPR) repeat protein
MRASRKHWPALALAVGVLSAELPLGICWEDPRAGGGARAYAQSPEATAGIPTAQEIAGHLAQAQDAMEKAELAKGEARTRLLEQARQGFGFVNAYQPGNPAAWFGMAEVSRKLRHMKEAMEYYAEYIDLPDGKTDYRAYEGLGQVYLDSNYFRQALPQFKRATDLNAASASAWDGLARAYRGLHDTNQAHAAVSKALELDPNNAAIMKTFAEVCLSTVGEDYRIGHPEWLDEALRACNRALGVLHTEWERKPEETDLLEQMVEFHNLIISITESQLRAGPDIDPELVIRLVRTRQQLREVESLLADHQSLVYLYVGLRENQENVDLLTLAVQLELKLNLLEQVRAHCEEILKLQPENEQARNILNDLSS